MNNNIVRILALGSLVFFIFLAVREKNKPDNPGPETVDGEVIQPVEPPGGWRNAGIMFTWMVLAAVVTGAVVLKWVAPMVGDKIGESFYDAPEKAEMNPTQKAIALITRGNYSGALEAFRKITEDEPQNRFAVVEMAKLLHDKLGHPEAAVEVYEEAATRDWPEDDKCFFLLKLADLHATDRQDFARARHFLEQVQSEFPGSRHAANAHHKMREIEEAEFLAARQH